MLLCLIFTNFKSRNLYNFAFYRVGPAYFLIGNINSDMFRRFLLKAFDIPGGIRLSSKNDNARVLDLASDWLGRGWGRAFLERGGDLLESD